MYSGLQMDRTFDAACVTKDDPIWANKILSKIKAVNPTKKAEITKLYNFYVDLLEKNPAFGEGRKEYMLENKETIKLDYK